MMRHQVITNPEEHDTLAVAVQHRVEQCTELRAHIAHPGHLAIEHIEEPCKQDQATGPTYIGKIAAMTFLATFDKNDRNADIQDKPCDRHEIGRKPDFDQPFNQRVNNYVNAFLQAVPCIGHCSLVLDR